MAIALICGLPGSGKSYYMTREIVRARKKGKKIFTNYPIRGCYKLEKDDILYRSFPENSLLCIDEANSWFNSRKWQQMPIEAFQFFMHHRHFKLDMILVAQIPTTLDVNIRDICSYYVWSRAYYMPFTERVLMFTYTYYYTVEDLVNFRNPFRVERVIPSGKIFKEFDTYYKFVELQRRKIREEIWDTYFMEEIIKEEEEKRNKKEKKFLEKLLTLGR